MKKYLLIFIAYLCDLNSYSQEKAAHHLYLKAELTLNSSYLYVGNLIKESIEFSGKNKR